MSQAKVDRYKKEKANRKQAMKKEKAKSILLRCAAAAVCAALVGWFGYSAYDTYEENKGIETVELDYSSIDSFSTNLSEAAD